MAPFKNRREELTTEADCLLWGGRVVIPSSLRDTVKRELHEGHFGCTRMKQLARRFVWWPGLDAELEALARGCQACVAKRAEPPQAARHPWEPTDGPWQRVHADFAGPMLGHYLLIMVDSYTKWIEAVPMTTTTAARTVAVMRDIFARMGLPMQLVTDNGPQFVSQEFAAFMRSNGIRHTRVAPHHPSSNGLAERAVGTVKNALRVCAASGGGVDLALSRALLAYRVTPHAATGRTPAEMLFGRNLRTRMNLMVPSAETALQAARDRQRETAGGRSREFAVGATVWARSYDGRQKWVRGTVVARPDPVSYEVDVGHVVWSRHVDQLLAAAAEPGGSAGDDTSAAAGGDVRAAAGGDVRAAAGGDVRAAASDGYTGGGEWPGGTGVGAGVLVGDGRASGLGDGGCAGSADDHVGERVSAGDRSGGDGRAGDRSGGSGDLGGRRGTGDPGVTSDPRSGNRSGEGGAAGPSERECGADPEGASRRRSARRRKCPRRLIAEV